MAKTIVPDDVQLYLSEIIPKIETEISDGKKPVAELVEMYKIYEELLRVCSPYDFISFNKYLEFDEDKTDKNKGFYHHRRHVLKELFQSYTDMEIHDMYDMMLVMMPPRVGKSQTSIRFLAWIIGLYPEETQLGTSYSDNITTSFYSGVLEIVTSDRYKLMFPESLLINQNAKREEIWLKVSRRYPSILFVPINGAMTGRSEASKYLYCDDLVSGIEEALSLVRLESLWQKYTINAKQRRKDGSKEIHVATPWSVHDPISKIATIEEGNPRCKILRYSCYNEDGTSAFGFFGGFSTEFYNGLQRDMDEASFSALYLQEPIERDGLLYAKDDFKYYLELPEGEPDTIVAICDSKNLGADYVASPVAKIYGDDIYIDDVVYNAGLPEVTKVLVANCWYRNKVVRGDIEMNNGGNYYAEGIDNAIKARGGKTALRLFYTSNNKRVKIITYSDTVKKRFIFKEPSLYTPTSEYGQFMRDVFRWTQSGKNKHDDSVDSLAMLAQLIQDLEGTSVKVMDRKLLRL